MPSFDHVKKLPPATKLVEHHDEPRVRVNEWLGNLRANGYKLTAARQALIEIIASSQQALSVPQILALTETQHPTLGRATVYRTLEMLEELGLLQRLHDAHGCHRYLAAMQPQPAVVCEACGRLAYLDDTILQVLLYFAEKQCAYQIQSYLLQFSGLCADCRP